MNTEINFIVFYFGASFFVLNFLSFPKNLQIMNQRSIIYFPTENTFNDPTSPQYLKHFCQFLTWLADGKGCDKDLKL